MLCAWTKACAEVLYFRLCINRHLQLGNVQMLQAGHNSPRPQPYVVFLADTDTGAPFELPLDRHGIVARSFEWNEDGPAELQPGAWPLDEVYATYAHTEETHLLIPHVGGRRCNLAWHHPRLERLVEIGSPWGHFEWLLRDTVRRG